MGSFVPVIIWPGRWVLAQCIVVRRGNLYCVYNWGSAVYCCKAVINLTWAAWNPHWNTHLYVIMFSSKVIGKLVFLKNKKINIRIQMWYGVPMWPSVLKAHRYQSILAGQCPCSYYQIPYHLADIYIIYYFKYKKAALTALLLKSWAYRSLWIVNHHPTSPSIVPFGLNPEVGTC